MDFVKIFNAAKNWYTIDEITQLVKFIDKLVSWLKQVSTITDETKLKGYFETDEGTNKVSGFIANFEKFTQSVEKIKLDVGISIKNDNILIVEENTFFKTYRQVPEIYGEFKNITATPDFKTYYETVIQQLIIANLRPNKEIDKQSIFKHTKYIRIFNL